MWSKRHLKIQLFWWMSFPHSCHRNSLSGEDENTTQQLRKSTWCKERPQTFGSRRKLSPSKKSWEVTPKLPHTGHCYKCWCVEETTALLSVKAMACMRPWRTVPQRLPQFTEVFMIERLINPKGPFCLQWRLEAFIFFIVFGSQTCLVVLKRQGGKKTSIRILQYRFSLKKSLQFQIRKFSSL